jgi:Tetratricopeptide repeat
MALFAVSGYSGAAPLALVIVLILVGAGYLWYRKRRSAREVPPVQPSKPARPSQSDPVDRYKIMFRLQILAGIGCVLILLYALRFWASGETARIFAVGVLVAGAALSGGFLMGFIFGIPRVGGKAIAEAAAVPGGAHASASDAESSAVTPNSNLVEISDWLTKIIVGVGLVELNSIPGKLGALAYYLGPSLRPAQCDGKATCADYIGTGQAAGLAIIFFYFMVGFLLGYVWTRLYFQRDLEVQKLRWDQWLSALIRLAEVSINQGQLDEAMRALDQALQFDPYDGRAVLSKARVLKRQAMQKAENSPERKELLNLALAFANQSITLLPTLAEPFYNKACYQALLGVGKTEVLQNLQSAFRLDDKLRGYAKSDTDLQSLWEDDDFKRLTGQI